MLPGNVGLLDQPRQQRIDGHRHHLCVVLKQRSAIAGAALLPELSELLVLVQRTPISAVLLPLPTLRLKANHVIACFKRGRHREIA